MDKDKQRAIAQSGGRSAQKTGAGHKWGHETAVAAGKLGGAATARNKREASK